MPLADLKAELELSYTFDCSCGECEQFPNLADYNADAISGIMANMAEQVWREKGSDGTINREATIAFAQQLWNGVLSGYGDNFTSVDYNTPDWNMLASLRQNVWHFSAAKNYAQLRELSSALIGEDGKLVSKAAFIAAAMKINADFSKHFGATEYELAVAGSQMASKWATIKQDDILEFDAIIDGQTTALCASLHGTRLPASSSFWNKYYPPNHWRCRSTVRIVYGGSITPAGEIPGADIPPMFQTNLGKAGLIFPAAHPYFKDIPAGIALQAMAALRKELMHESKERLQGKTVEVDGLGTVGFSSKSIKEIFNQPHAEYMLKNQLAYVSDTLLANSTVVANSKDSKGDAKLFHYLQVDGLPNNYLVVKEFEDGRKVLYSIVDGLK